MWFRRLAHLLSVVCLLSPDDLSLSLALHSLPDEHIDAMERPRSKKDGDDSDDESEESKEIEEEVRRQIQIEMKPQFEAEIREPEDRAQFVAWLFKLVIVSVFSAASLSFLVLSRCVDNTGRYWTRQPRDHG